MKDLLIPKKTKYTKKRYGANEDGGYILLSEILGQSSVVYSYGLGDIISFDVDVANSGKNVFMYDPTINYLPEFHPNFYFFKEPFNKSFLKHLQENKHDHLTDITLKIDVEGAEYDLIESCRDFYRNFSQIVIEFHGLKENDARQIKVLELLNENYFCVHIHANNHGLQNGWLPDTLEITYLRKDFFDSEPEIETIRYPIEGLDFPNYNTRADYLLDWWV